MKKDILGNDYSIIASGKHSDAPLMEQLAVLGKASVDLAEAIGQDSKYESYRKLDEAFCEHHGMHCDAFDELYRASKFYVHRKHSKALFLGDDDIRDLFDVACEIAAADVDGCSDWADRILKAIRIESDGDETEELF